MAALGVYTEHGTFELELEHTIIIIHTSNVAIQESGKGNSATAYSDQSSNIQQQQNQPSSSQQDPQMKGRNDVLDSDKLSMYDQDDLLQLAFVARETLVELESENHFLR